MCMYVRVCVVITLFSRGLLTTSVNGVNRELFREVNCYTFLPVRKGSFDRSLIELQYTN